MKDKIEPIINDIICKLCYQNLLIEGANMISRPKQVKHTLKAQVFHIAVYINFVAILNNNNSLVLLTLGHCTAPHISG